MVKLLMLCCLLTFSAVGGGGFYLSNVRSVVKPMITGSTSWRPIDPIAIIKRRSQKAADARDEASRAKPIEVQNNSLQEQQGTQVARAGAKRRSAVSRKPVHWKTKFTRSTVRRTPPWLRTDAAWSRAVWQRRR
jgi:hypothetical protein